MFILFFTIFSFCIEAALLPPGFVIRQFGHTRDKVSTAKIEQKVSYSDGSTFNETMLFKAPNKYRVVVSGDNGNVTFIRNGAKCVAVSSQKRIELPCAPLTNLFYYDILLSNNDEMINFLKLLKIDPRESVVSMKKDENDEKYIKPDGIVLVNYNNKPIYVIGVTDSLYKSIAGNASGKTDIGKTLIEELRYRTPQVWMDKDKFWPLRVFGQYNGNDFDLSLGSYIVDGNEVPFPKSIALTIKNDKAVSYGVSTFETGVDIKDDVFKMDGFRTLPLAKQEDLDRTRSRMIDYIKEYR